ncbi:uncharacterized protein LOC142178330 [Nicotiana tabacum]|uniref:Uncharacterized protein LOC142178330 n=1 Tax=Nicotiana tabacum TaxID=4097 RepID=A0AC58U2P7_TOBAC
MADNEVSSLDHNHPLFLQALDAPGLVLILLKLTGPENYALWCRAMKLALRGKSKLGFVDGSCVKGIIVYASNAKKVWADFQERFDRSNLTRIYHIWTAIATLRQGTDSVTSYYSKMKDLWDELDFLMGLNESYGNIRSNVLAKRLVITVNEAYAIVTQEESQRTLGVTNTLKDPFTMIAEKIHEFRPRRPGLVCDYCGYKGHLKKNYYKIVGYPPDFKSKKKGQNLGGRTYVNNSTTSEEKQAPMLPTQGNFFTED